MYSLTHYMSYVLVQLSYSDQRIISLCFVCDSNPSVNLNSSSACTGVNNVNNAKCRTDNLVSASSQRPHSPLISGKKGSVFDILFQPEGKAASRISEAWIQRMKHKKKHRWKSRSCKNLEVDPPPCSSVGVDIDKYFDNLVTILQHSASCLDLQIEAN